MMYRSAFRTLRQRIPPLRSFATSIAGNAAVPHHLDVLIVGGGVVGSTLACDLAARGKTLNLSVAMIENAAMDSIEAVAAKADVDPRVFAITPGSRRIFDQLGVWDAMAKIRAPSFQQMQVWDALADGALRFDCSDVQQAQLGYIVENRVLQSVLFDRCKQLAASGHLHLMCPASVKAVHFPIDPVHAIGNAPGSGALQYGEPAQVTLTDGTTVRAKLVVAADGAQSRVRQAANIGTWGWDYDQRAVVATVKTAAPHDTAWQRFLPTGPVAILPLGDNLSSIVWSTTPQHADTLCAASTPEEFLKLLNAALRAPSSAFISAQQSGHIYPTLESISDKPMEADPSLYHRERDGIFLDPGSILRRAGTAMLSTIRSIAPSSDAFVMPPEIVGLAGPRLSFPLRFQKANSYYRYRLALVGDAAHTVHPLAGQNLNLGIGDAAALANAVVDAAADGGDVGSSSMLADYDRKRRTHNLGMMLALDAVKRVFLPSIEGHSVEPMIQLRNIGMSMLNAAKPVKAQIMAYAMGQE